VLNNVFLKGLRERRLSLSIWAVAVIAMTMLQVLLYPSIGKSFDMEAFLKNMSSTQEKAMKVFIGNINFNTPTGYLNGRLFFLMIPLLLLILAISLGSDALAGEEGRGTLDLLLSTPLCRRRAVLEKYATLCAAVLAVSIAFYIGLAVCALAVSMDISYLRMAEATFSAVLLALTFGAVALLAGAASGSKGLAIGLSAALAVGAYLINSLAAVVEGMEPWRKLSPFYYYIGDTGKSPLETGINWVHASILIGLTVVFLAATIVWFDQRDLAA